LGIFIWIWGPELDDSRFLVLPYEGEVMGRLPVFQLSPAVVPPQDSPALIALGKTWFFETRFSQNGAISCGHCHQAEKAFSDGLPQAKGLKHLPRRSPSLLNVALNHWFFWDGRADSLEQQALGPLENPGEHGTNRLAIAHVIREHHRTAYEENFGPWPAYLDATLPPHAMPAAPSMELSPKLATYTLASAQTFSRMNALLAAAENNHRPVWQEVSHHIVRPPSVPEAWVTAWVGLSTPIQDSVNQVFSQVGIAIAAYERTLLSLDAPFDRFAQRVFETRSIDSSFVPGFGKEEYEGFRIFLATGCANCHSGATFTDQQFHHIGLSMQESVPAIDVGRAAGILLAQGDKAFSCLGPYFTHTKESCLELPHLDTESLDAVGAFKTPSLRNVAKRAPYGHDGRFPTLRSILLHYNELPETKGMGHREETLFPLDLPENELTQLEAFLRSLDGR
jgi:cytochrome c peroxidase